MFAIASSRIVFAVVAHGGVELLGRRAVEVDVQRHHPPLDVAVPDDERSRRARSSTARASQLVEQLGREPIERQREVRELERVRHPPDPVDVLRHRELRLTVARSVSLAARSGPDHLEHVRDTRAG